MKSKSLAELRPTIDKDAYVAYDCDCGIMKAGLLGILPKDTIKQLLTKPPSSENNDDLYNEYAEYSKEGYKERVCSNNQNGISTLTNVEAADALELCDDDLLDTPLIEDIAPEKPARNFKKPDVKINNHNITIGNFVDAINEYLEKLLNDKYQK